MDRPSEMGAALQLSPLRSVGTKLAGATLAILCGVAFVFFLYVSQSERERVLAAKEATGVAVTGLFAQGVEASVAFNDTKGVEEQVTLFLSAPSVVHASVFGLDPSGAPLELASGGPSPPHGSFDLSAPRALVGSVQRGREQILVEAPILAAGKPVGFTRVAFSLVAENAAISRTEGRALWSAAAVGLGIAALLIGLTRSLLVRRLAALASAARRLQRGEHVVIGVRGDDEVGALATAFSSMASAIESRELQIKQRNRDLRRVLDNVDAGFLTVDLEGRMALERSRILDTWFGLAPGDSFFEWIAEHAPVVAHSLRNGWRDLADDFMPVEVILDQLPSRMEVRANTYALRYAPVLEEERLVSIVVTITDATAEVRQAIAERAQREAMAVFRRLVDDRAGFTRFIAEGERILATLRAHADRTMLLRELHTLKGNSAVYELESISSACHALEDRLADEGGTQLAPDLVAKLESVWSNLRALVAELGGSTTAPIEITPGEHRALLDAIKTGALPCELERLVAALAMDPARANLARAAQQTRTIARRLSKPVRVNASVSPPELRLDGATWKPIWLAVPHLLRNALDHGIESSSARLTAGKREEGEIRLTLIESAEMFTFIVADDGAGIDWTKLRAAAEKRGLPSATESDLVEALFADEVSTRSEVSETSGRGVGATAVRAAVEAVGGRVRVTTVPGRGTTFTLEIPKDRRLALVPASGEASRAA